MSKFRKHVEDRQTKRRRSFEEIFAQRKSRRKKTWENIHNERTNYDSKKGGKSSFFLLLKLIMMGVDVKIIITKTYNDTSTPEEKRDLFRIC